MEKKFEQKDFTGVLFKNDKKEKDSQPDLTGNVMLNHVKYRLAAWRKEGKKGAFLSLVVSEFQDSKKQEKKEDNSLGF